MEGNFYVAESVVRRELKSELGKSFANCSQEADAYALCLETGHINKQVKKDLCKAERDVLDRCAEADWRSRRGGRR